MKIGFIGCGKMGGALARAVAKAEDVEILVADRSKERIAEMQGEIPCTASTAAEMAATCDFIFLGVKPDGVRAALCELAGSFDNKECTVVSMAAGVSLDTLESCLDSGRPIIRIMPNTPADVEQGMIVYAPNACVTEEQEAAFLRILKRAGRLDRLAEEKIDAATAIMGCGPAFAYLFTEALADGGVLCGLPRDKAIVYAAQMMRGAAEMVLQKGQHPGKLKDDVCSPGGSTIEGVRALEEGGFRATAMNAVIAAYEKNKKLG